MKQIHMLWQSAATPSLWSWLFQASFKVVSFLLGRVFRSSSRARLQDFQHLSGRAGDVMEHRPAKQQPALGLGRGGLDQEPAAEMLGLISDDQAGADQWL
ncbi:MAG: hypothetical protein KJ626_07705 [Verrucomicrobia bacterium]|nr:hypothetical protein [Verrucomicrobiota bacterium]